jgi:hypothetical protein
MTTGPEQDMCATEHTDVILHGTLLLLMNVVNTVDSGVQLSMRIVAGKSAKVPERRCYGYTVSYIRY